MTMTSSKDKESCFKWLSDMTNKPEADGTLTPSLQQRSVLWLFKGN